MLCTHITTSVCQTCWFRCCRNPTSSQQKDNENENDNENDAKLNGAPNANANENSDQTQNEKENKNISTTIINTVNESKISKEEEIQENSVTDAI